MIESIYGDYQELRESDTFSSLNKSAELSDSSLLRLATLLGCAGVGVVGVGVGDSDAFRL